MKNKLMTISLTLVTLLGLTNLDSLACTCSSDSSPCSCGEGCSCDSKK
jgi:hypothetical protein